MEEDGRRGSSSFSSFFFLSPLSRLLSRRSPALPFAFPTVAARRGLSRGACPLKQKLPKGAAEPLESGRPTQFYSGVVVAPHGQAACM